MRSANRPTAVFLLLMAVLCSPAGVCVIDGFAAGVQASAPAHVHACCAQADGTFIGAHDASCCAEGRKGFVNVYRFLMQEQAAPSSFPVATSWTPPTFVVDVTGVGRAAPLVLRI
jgi:hypothetical protein